MRKVLPLVVFAGVLVASYYFIFSGKEFESKTDSSKAVPTSEEEGYLNSLDENKIQTLILNTLPDAVLKAEFGGKVFCSSHLFGYESDTGKRIVNVYLYAYCEEYYLKGNSIVLGSGISLPLKLVYKVNRNGLTIESVSKPEEGGDYQSSIKEIFPDKYVGEILKGIDVVNLVPSAKVQAENYYKGRLEVYF